MEEDDTSLITEQIIDELRQEREKEDLETLEAFQRGDVNNNFVDLLLTIEEDIPSGIHASPIDKTALFEGIQC